MAQIQTEYKIIIYNPTSDLTKFATDVYVKHFDPTETSSEETKEERIYCGKGGQSRGDSIKSAFHDVVHH